ncbi:MAG: cation transporter [Bacteroidia bacterium]|nr:cation transporter [Bacteroidia bacterium]
MKLTRISLFLLIGLFLFSSCTDHRIKTKFFTQGGCEECQAIIEEALKKTKGVDSVSWDFETSLTTIVFDTTKTNESKLQQLVAKKGFNTTYFDADVEAAKALPECCTKVIERSLIPKGIHGH